MEKVTLKILVEAALAEDEADLEGHALKALNIT